MHRMKLMHVNAFNQNKSSVADGNVVQIIKEEPKEKEEPIEEEVEEPVKIIEKVAISGMFRDNKRRIDMVLVVEDKPFAEAADTLKTDFLTNIVKTGLQVEVEPGVMSAHKNLLFIKIHAPDRIITEYGEIFGVKRHFVENHLDSLNPILTIMKDTERDWIKLIRKNYSKSIGYSYFERSLIVYKILLHLPFGDQANHYGINRLLERNVLLDAYALHDGPYHFMPDQSVVGSNARQILYYEWSGFKNIFKSQPLHLIHEYFGPKCEKWRRCPHRELTEYCYSMDINILLDHPYLAYFSLFTVLWAFTFITLWKRKEYILKWMWELNGVDLYYKNANRPEYERNYRQLGKSLITGLVYNENRLYKLLRFLFTKGLVLVYLWAIPAMMRKTMIEHDIFYDKSKIWRRRKDKRRDYRVLAMFQTRNILTVSVLEMMYHVLSTVIVRFENHSTYKAYEESLVMKEFGFSFISIYSYMGYIGWLVDQLRIFLGACIGNVRLSPMVIVHNFLSRWTQSPWEVEKYCLRYCWPFTCIIELSILVTATLLVKSVVFHALNFILRLRTFFFHSRDDTVPCWEREYTLNNVDEGFLLRRYHFHAFQFCMATLFVVACPLAPLLMFVLNFFELRYIASQLIMTSRRPLHIRKPGIGVWNKIFTFIAYASIITNVATLIFTTRLILRYYMDLKKIPTKNIFEKIITRLETAFVYTPTCYSNDILIDIQTYWPLPRVFFKGLQPRLFTSPMTYQLHLYKMGFLLLFVHFTGLYAFIIKHLFPPYKREIEETKAAERRIKTLYYHYKKVNPNPKKK
ncbi:anoctamin-5-like [Vanessa atalanta]|uniref:anoctamin-5-like n=1 Tax=Vanessa atalanta TaxID=42275 RepID=UPI001FCD728A|nr:anoctamin-5-like [Vanessa atalanta]